MVIWFDPFADGDDRAEAAIEAHAQALAAIDATEVEQAVAASVGRLAPALGPDAAALVPAATREILRLAAERRSVALCLARLRAPDPILGAMFDGLVLHVAARVAAARAQTTTPPTLPTPRADDETL